MTVLTFPGHHWHRCKSEACPACRGGLSLCNICGGTEASLPTDCPGRRMSENEQDMVQAGRTDFQRRTGWS